MTAKVREPETPAPGPDPEAPDRGEVVISQWQFLSEPPTREAVLELLATLPPVWGVKTVDFADYVQALPSKIKTEKPAASNPRVKETIYVDAWTLYMSVGGRIKMIEAAAYAHDWEVDFEPEPVTPTAVPGYLAFGDKQGERLVYRVGVVIQEHRSDTDRRRLGRKTGTAWVPASGGSNAAGSNPYEKVETSALGRALGAWGFGVLPGSGVATVEEMQGIQQNRAAMSAEGEGTVIGSGRGPRQTREQQLERVLTAMEKVRQLRGESDEEMKAKAAKYLTGLGVQGVYDQGKNELDWTRVKPGQLELLANSLTDAIVKIEAEQAPV